MNKFNSTSASNQAGFTLLEILIAITLLAFITLGVVNITENAVLTKERTTEVNRNNLQVETALSRFEWDFSQIYSPLYFSTVMNLRPDAQAGMQGGTAGGNQGAQQGGFQGGGTQGVISPELQIYHEQLVLRFERNEHFSAVSREGLPIPRFYSPEKDVFEFFTSANRRKLENMKQSHFAWVRYALATPDPREKTEEENPNIPKSLKNLVRYFSADNPYDDKRINIDDTQNVKGAVILENVESLQFEFWDYQRRKWETNLRTIAQGEGLIRGVRIKLAWYDYSGNKRTITRVFRNHWPMVVPQDQPVNNNRTRATQAGSAQGGPTEQED
jgi:prepilin-type N-terminal cleavage/methylation domain-containing protein